MVWKDKRDWGTEPVPPPVTRATMPFTEKRFSTLMGADILTTL
jgi:hypothetical protein